MYDKAHNDTHNGWSNYETSVVAYWINMEEVSQRHWRSVAWQYQQEAARGKEASEDVQAAEFAAQRGLVNELKEVFGLHPTAAEESMHGDLLKAALAKVNWQEIAESLLEFAEPVEHPVFGPVISVYTREQAIHDGVLVDVTKTAKEAGIVYPMALTQAVWADYVEVPEGVSCQDEQGRLWDILTMFRFAAKRSPNHDTIQFRVLVKNDDREPQEVTLKAICGPGDTPEPVITVMLPNED
jgi:hypothetical protein